MLAPNFFAQPPIAGSLQVVAFTSQPGSVSVSSAFTITTLHLSVDPDHVDQPQPVGRAIVLRAQLLDQLNRPVLRGGVAVYLGQVTYTQQDLVLSDAVISGDPAGTTPVAASTNAHGVATFVVRGTSASINPVCFEANLVNGTQFSPYGYSQIVPVRFRQR